MQMRLEKGSAIQPEWQHVCREEAVKLGVLAAACLFDAEQRGLSGRPLFKSQFKAFVNDVEKDPAQDEERRPEGREVHIQQILPGHLVGSKLGVCWATAGQVA